VLRGSHFCANCGRLLDAPAGGDDTVIVSRESA
jgi:ribosomal protein S27E